MRNAKGANTGRSHRSLEVLKSLARLKDWEIEQQRILLARLNERTEDVEQELRALSEDMQKQIGLAKRGKDIALLLVQLGAYLKASRVRLSELRAEIDRLRQEITAETMLLKTKWSEAKTYEILIERRYAAMLIEVNRMEELIRGELASARHFMRAQS